MECNHDRSECRFNHYDKKIVYQCLDCGEIVRPAIPGEFEPEERAQMESFDFDFRRLCRSLSRYEETEAIKANRDLFQRKAEYQEYLQSADWQEKRQLVLKRCNHVCEGCGTARATQVHHLTYANKYDELLFQLVGICDSCHKKIHKL